MNVLECEWQHKLLDALPARISRVRADGRILWCNRVMRDYFAIDDPQCEPLTVVGLLGKEHADAQTPYVARVLAGETVQFNPVKLTLGGNDVASVTLVPDTGLDGTVRGYFSFAVDVTEHHRAREAEAMLTAALRNISEGVALYDSQDRLVFTNDAARSHMDGIGKTVETGMTFEELLRKFTLEYMGEKPEQEREAYVAQRVEQHRNPNGPIEIVSGPSWLLANEQRTEMGGMLTIYTDVTELKRRELALERAERRYAVAAEAAHTGVWEWNLDTGIVFVDPSLKRLIGYADDEIGDSAEQWFSYVHPNDKDCLIAAAERHLQGKTEEFLFEHRKRHKNGSERWFLSRGRALPETGGGRRLIGADVDITERKQAEHELSGSEERYRTLLEAFPEGMVVASGQGIVFANTAAARMHGLEKPEDLVGKRFSELLDVEERDRKFKDKERLFSDGEGFFGQPYRHRRFDTGEEVLTEDSDYRIKWEGGYAALIVMRDITERRLTEQALRESEERYRTLVNMIPDAVMVARNGTFEFANQRAADMHGIASVDDLLRMAPTDLIHPSFHENIAKRVSETEQGASTPIVEHIHVRKDNGALINVEKTSRGIMWQGSLAALIVARDVTERKAAEQAMRESEELYRTLVNLLPDAVVVSSGGEIVFANRGAAVLHGTRDAGDLVGIPFDDLVHPDFRADVAVRRHRLTKLEGPVPLVEHVHLKANGEEFHVEKTGQGIMWQGRPASLIVIRDIADRKRAERELRENERQLRLVTDNVPAMICYIDKDETLRFANHHYADWNGALVEQIVGRSVKDIIGPKQYETTKEHRVKVLSGEEVTFRGMRLIDGTVHRYRATYIPHLGDSKRVQGYFAFIIDISEEERMAEALRESESLLRLVTDNIPTPVGYVDVEGRYKFVSKAYEEWFQVPREKILGSVNWEMRSAAFEGLERDRMREMYRAEVEEALKGKPVVFYGERTFPDGVHRHVRKMLVPNLTEGDRASGVFILISDITEVKENEALLQLIMDNVPALISYLEPDGRFKYVSKQYEEWFGVQREALVGEVAWDFLVSRFPPEEREALRKELRDELQRTLAGEFVTVDTERQYPGDKKYRYVRKTMIPDLRDAGAPRGVFSHISDITALKRQEQELRQARDEAQQANKSKSRFLASASHDLRQPLQALNLLSFALSESIGSEEECHLVDDMRQALTVMESVLNALIDISKLDAGVITPDFQDVPLAGLCRQIRASFDVQARQKGLELRIMPCEYTAHTDPELLARILDNLVSNAIKYTDEGRVLVGVRRVDSQLRIEVHDSGQGIPPEELGQIFEEFYQLDNPARDRNKGLGLGLAIVQRTARLLGHPVDARSLPGHGSTFTVMVPLGNCAEATDQSADLAPDDGDLEGYGILVVEDDETVRSATKRILQRWGAQVATAGSMDEALAQIEEYGFTPDLIVADYSLPGHQTGTRTIAAIRDRMGHQVAGIIITGDIAADRMTEAHDAKLQVLQKPVDPGHLRRLIGSLIEDSGI